MHWSQMEIDPIWVEAKAALLSVSSTHFLGLNNIIFEGDALNVIEPIRNSSIKPHWAISSIIVDITFLLLSSKPIVLPMHLMHGFPFAVYNKHHV